jgi:hypothetical protein
MNWGNGCSPGRGITLVALFFERTGGGTPTETFIKTRKITVVRAYR